MPTDGAVQVKGDGNKGSMGPPGCSATRPEAALLGALHPWQESGLAKIGEVGEALVARSSFPVRRVCRPAFRGGFCVSGFRCRGLAQMEPCAQRIPRAARACTSILRAARVIAPHLVELMQANCSNLGGGYACLSVLDIPAANRYLSGYVTI